MASELDPDKKMVVVAGPNGGQLRQGNVDSRGRVGPITPHAIRDILRYSFVDRVDVLTTIASGAVCQEIQVPAKTLAPYLVCGVCGASEVRPKVTEAGFDLGEINVTVQASANPKDRIAALELMAKYGLGAIKEVSTEHVKQRLSDTITLLHALLPEELLIQLLPKLKEVWSA